MIYWSSRQTHLKEVGLTQYSTWRPCHFKISQPLIYFNLVGFWSVVGLLQTLSMFGKCSVHAWSQSGGLYKEHFILVSLRANLILECQKAQIQTACLL